MDFTLKRYSNLLKAFLEKGYTILSLEDYFGSMEAYSRVIVLRHDIDKHPKYALNTAKIEHEMGISSTYYFKYRDDIFIPGIMDKIQSLGHKIGYHYEDLSVCRGNYEAAIDRFQNNLGKFRKLYQVDTICSDGSPLSRYDNRDLWKNTDYKDYGLLGEPYFDLDFNQFLYLTDTGRIWNGMSYNVRDKVPTSFEYNYKKTRDIIEDIQANRLPDHIHITTHPQRWHDRPLPWTKELVWQNIKNVVKGLLIKIRN